MDRLRSRHAPILAKRGGKSEALELLEELAGYLRVRSNRALTYPMHTSRAGELTSA